MKKVRVLIDKLNFGNEEIVPDDETAPQPVDGPQIIGTVPTHI